MLDGAARSRPDFDCTAYVNGCITTGVIAAVLLRKSKESTVREISASTSHDGIGRSRSCYAHDLLDDLLTVGPIFVTRPSSSPSRNTSNVGLAWLGVAQPISLIADLARDI